MQQFGVDRLFTVFQPIVDLETREVIAHEALTRGSLQGETVPPDRLYGDAYRAGLAAELDDACISTTLQSAEAQRLSLPGSLFVNVEPSSFLGGRVPAGLLSAPPMVVEITERALTTDPSGLLEAAAALRAAGHLIALDDVGAEPASLALLPLLAPEIVKLDMGLILGRPDRLSATVMTTISAYVDESGAAVLAEGIETEKHIIRARALGATFGQGWHFGRPDETPRATSGTGIRSRAKRTSATGPAHAAATPFVPGCTPFDLVASSAAVRVGDRALLVEVSKLLEDRAAGGGDTSVLLATFQSDDNISEATRLRYEHLVATGCLLTVYSTIASADLPHPARSVVIDRSDPLGDEWDVVLLTADYAAALLAREVDASLHEEGNYEFVLTTDRRVVVEAARALLTR